MLKEGSAFARRKLDVFTLRGKDVRDLVQRLTTNDVKKPPQGALVGNVFTSEKGRILAMVTLRMDEGGMTVVGAGAALQQWIDQMTFREDVRIEPRSDHSVVSLIGSGPELLGIPGTHLIGAEGELQTQIDVWRNQGYTEASPEALEWWRVMRGIPAWGKELDEQRNPHEARLGALIDWNKGCYIGQEVVARLDTYKKVQRHLTKLALDRPVPEHALLDESAGEITSCAALDGAPYVAALGYVKAAFSDRTAFTIDGVSARVIAW